jgi:hypothetical protein
MDDPQTRQKQISQRYVGAVDYLRRPHYFRSLRIRLFVLAVIASIIGTLAFSYWGRQDAFSPGPISQNHARFGSDCRACHLDADQTFSKLGKLTSFASMFGGAMATQASTTSSIARMDVACLRCHPADRLHLPQVANFAVRAVSRELTVVHATGCAACHREHDGRDRMALPSQQACISCHNDAGALALTRRTVHLDRSPVASSGENRDLGDDVIRFLTPERPAEALPPFPSYAQGHPGFAWEQPGVSDPALLKFNHKRHFGHDLPKVNNHRLGCADCHQPGADGVFFQPVKYERHCAQCHTLQFQPSLPTLLIPHGDPEKVRYFLASREVSFELALRTEGIKDPDELKKSVKREMDALERRVPGDLRALERRVFFEGDPPDLEGDRAGRAGIPKFLTACVKCHYVSEGNASHAPTVQPPNMAERWVQHGPFTHLPHQHMDCIDCHGAAQLSTQTSDILLPPQKVCTECHRASAQTSEALVVTAQPADLHALAAAQRANGGVKWDCTSCHSFHTPSDTQVMIDALAPATTKPAGSTLPK